MSVSIRKNGYWRELAALFAGLAFPFAFAPFECVPLAYVSLGVLFFVWQEATPGRAFMQGFLFGLGEFTLGVYWIHVCLHDFAGATDLAAFVITAAAVVFLAIFPALAGLLAAKLSLKTGLSKLLLVFPGCWILSEWLRAWLKFPGFPWLQIGYTQLEAIPGALAPVLGVYGVGFFVVLTIGAFLYCAQPDGPSRGTLLLSFVLLWAITALFYRFDWTSPVGRPVTVALLQGNIAQQLKWLPETKKQTLRWYIDRSREHWGSDLIVWPETAIPISYHRVAGLLEDLAQEASEHGSDLLIGLPIYDQRSELNYNGIVAVGNGEGRYLKRRLVPFGEYLPLQPVSGLIARHMDFQMANFSPGTMRQPPIRAAGLPLAPSICYEDVYGQQMLTSLPEARYLVNVTNDAWFGRSIALDQNLQMARFRSLETGRYLVRAANTGLTAIIAPKGDIAELASPFTATALSGEIQPMQGITPYMLVGDHLTLGLIAAALLLVVVPRKEVGAALPDSL